ncbi:Rho-type GTPase activating protein Rga1, partial [Dispira parvispora]
LDKDQIVDRAPPSLTVISEEQIYSIWTILSTFEESSAACISDMLIHVSKLRYMEALRVAEKFIFHVHIIFTAIDNLEDQLAHFDDATGLQHTKEPKFLCKRTICFFALLSHSHDLSSQGSEMAEELLSLVTGLAHYLKMLIRAALMGALKAEREYDSKVSLNGLLHKLTEINNRERLLQFRASHQDIHVTSDMCNHCHTTLEEECISYQMYRWHKCCFNCTKCGRNLKMARQHTGFDEKSMGVLCSRCCPPNLIQPGAFQIVTQLEQYSFLLRVALRRLHSRMWERHNEIPHEEHPQQMQKHITQGDAVQPFSNNSSDVGSDGLPKDDGLADKKSEVQPSPRPTSVLNSQPLSEKFLAKALHSSTDQARTFTEVKAKAHTRQSITGEDTPSQTHPSLDSAGGSLRRKATIERHNANEEAIKLVMVDQIMSAVTSGSDLSATPSSSSAAVHNNETGSETASGGPSSMPFRPMIIDQNNQRDRGRSFSPHHRAVGVRGPGATSPLLPAKPGIDAPPVTAVGSGTSSPHPVARPPPTSSVPPSIPAVPHTKPPLLCELGPMEHFLVKHVAVMRLAPLVQQYLVVDELLGMVGSRKQNFWTRLKANMNQKKKINPKMKDSVFGASLEELLERQGVESEHATISTPVRVPLFVDMCTTAIKGKNVSVEGIFRKNGNIRRLKELSDSIDQDIGSVDLSPETSVQCAALMKKFLREMAEPLLTFKLHKLFLACDRIKDDGKRCQALHYACCLLPLPNRDCIEVLFGLLRFVSDQATLDGDKGNRMDLGNLATVITPNILYSSSKDPIKDDSFAAIHVVYTMMVNQDQLWILPKDAAFLLQQEKL